MPIVLNQTRIPPPSRSMVGSPTPPHLQERHEPGVTKGLPRSSCHLMPKEVVGAEGSFLTTAVPPTPRCSHAKPATTRSDRATRPRILVRTGLECRCD